MTQKKALHKKKGIRRTPDVVAFNIISVVVVGLFALLCIMPFYLIIVGSFSSEKALIVHGYHFYIQDFTLEAYKMCFQGDFNLLTAYLNTILLTLCGTLLNTLVTTMTGYVLSRRDFQWRNIFAFFFFFTMLFNGGMVPSYIMNIRIWDFKNHWYALLLPLMFSVWNMIIAKNYMMSLPYEIIESAKIDGANDFTIYIRLMLPLSLPCIATLALFSGLAYWNDWMNCLLYINRKDMYTLQFYLQELLTKVDAIKEALEHAGALSASAQQTIPQESLKMAMTIVVTGPIILLYPFLQRYFVKGLTVGAVKG